MTAAAIPNTASAPPTELIASGANPDHGRSASKDPNAPHPTRAAALSAP